MKTYIAILRKANNTRKFILLIVLLYLLHGFFERTFHLSVYCSYILELCSLVIWLRKPFGIHKTQMYLTFSVFVALLVIDFLCDVLFLVNPMNVLMGFRGLFLPMVLLFASATYLTLQDYHSIFNLFYKFQWLNVFCTFVQWKFYGQKADFNNGALVGGAEQNFFCISLIVYYLFAYTHKRASLKQILFVVASSFFIAIIQDEKFIFVGAMLCGIFYFLSQKLRIRNIVGAVALFIGIIIAIKSMGEGQVAAMGTLDNALEYSQKTGSGYGFPRIGSSSQISNMFFNSDIQQAMGLGLGNCTEMKAPLVDTDFSDQYGYLGYHLFVFQDVFLETGWVGVSLYVGFFISLLFYNIKRRSLAPVKYKWLYDIASTISLVAILIIWYNCTLRIYYAVLPYIVLGLGPCITKTLNRRNEK